MIPEHTRNANPHCLHLNSYTSVPQRGQRSELSKWRLLLLSETNSVGSAVPFICIYASRGETNSATGTKVESPMRSAVAAEAKVPSCRLVGSIS